MYVQCVYAYLYIYRCNNIFYNILLYMYVYIYVYALYTHTMFKFAIGWVSISYVIIKHTRRFMHIASEPMGMKPMGFATRPCGRTTSSTTSFQNHIGHMGCHCVSAVFAKAVTETHWKRQKVVHRAASHHTAVYRICGSREERYPQSSVSYPFSSNSKQELP